ncbi:MAG: dienelactone hydrolase [Pseudoalteromonas tetraodonis]|jgi:dienelactone hydrolase
MKVFITTLVVALTAGFGTAAIKESAVIYKDGDVELEGFIAYDDGIEAGDRPGVLIVHQWTGLTDYEKGRARQLAELGYTAFALDIYGKGIRPDRSEASKFAGIYKGDRELYRRRLMAGLEVLKEKGKVDENSIAAIGYCFGGTGVLEIARAGVPLAGVISFHGGLNTAEGMAAKKDKVKAEVLVLHGADDPYVPADEVATFEEEMRSTGAVWSLVKYGDAVHSFSQKMAGNDKSKGAAYNKRADKLSWEDMRLFLDRVFAD